MIVRLCPSCGRLLDEWEKTRCRGCESPLTEDLPSIPAEPREGVRTEDRQARYEAKQLAGAYAAFSVDRERFAADGYDVVALDWQPGRRRTRDWVAAVFLTWFLIGILMIIIWLLAGKPSGTLLATYRLRADLPAR